KDIDIYDFTHYLLMVNREPNENNPSLKRLIEAIKDMQKEAKKEIKRDYSDTDLSTNQIKELLNNAKIPTSGRDAIIFGKNNLTPEIVEFLHKNNKKMIIEKASNKELELLQDANFRHPEDVRASLDHEAINHILKRHGVNSVNVRNGESPITYQDIANYRSFINGADDVFVDNNNLIAFKQINGYAVVVEQAVNRKSELVLKTMYKSNGDYKDNNAYKKLQDTKPSKGQP
uniref:PBECR3 domain-containing polyvalent protein n=1 Tax=Helicobacter pylori TaxID=210 RepID=UPI001E5A03EF